MDIRPPVDTGISGWQAVVPNKPAFPILDADITADWVIIGAGWAGLSAARRLLHYHPRDKIVILEAAAMATSPAGRNSGFMIDLPHDLSSGDYAGSLDKDYAAIRQNRAAIEYCREAMIDFDMPKDTILPIGKINAAASQGGMKHNIDFAHHLDQLGESYEMWDAHQMRQVTGSDYYQGGLYTAGCHLVQPAQFIYGLAQGLGQKCQIFEHSAVIDYTQQSADCWKLQTAKGSVSAARVILAVNGMLPRFGFYQQHLIPIFTYAAMTEVLDDDLLSGDSNWGITAAHPMGTSVRRYASPQGSRIVIRNRFTYDHKVAVSDQKLADMSVYIRKHFAARFPKLAQVKFDYLWAGRLCLSKNGTQIIEELKPNLYAACCQNGLGTTRGVFAAMALVDGLMNANTDYAQDISALAKPAKLPPMPFASIGAHALLRYRHWQAGGE